MTSLTNQPETTGFIFLGLPPEYTLFKKIEMLKI